MIQAALVCVVGGVLGWSIATQTTDAKLISRKIKAKAPEMEYRQLDSPPGTAIVYAKVKFVAKQRPQPFFWTMHVTVNGGELNGEMVVEKKYVDQMFVVEPGTTPTVDFKEKLELPPGKYHVWIAVEENTPTGDPEGRDLLRPTTTYCGFRLRVTVK